ncbi:O-antigen ligase family protein [Rubrolithibacter danxiaensis]|uniref:O-antigen ligase family protein n=1 Tax=Rubrolithibacter danxiaensis TaxID=3390805 RepID=UPI003BF77903
MFIFPLVYCSSFIYALKELIKNNKQGVLLFLIFGLPIYTTTLSVSFALGLGDTVKFFQSFKELIILALLGLSLWKLRTKPSFILIDYIFLAYFFYTLLYAILPIGEYVLTERLIAFKSTSFFVLVYFSGRFFDINEINISKYFHYILLLAIAAAVLVVYEWTTQQHFQTLTGYSDYNYYFFNQEPSGNYNLTWTFETQTGLKRFASFFSDPLEHSASTLFAFSVLAALYTRDDNKLTFDSFGTIAFLATILSIFLALSRAALVSYFIIIYVYGIITKKKYILHTFHLLFLMVLIYFLFLLKNRDIYDFVIDSITFQNASSIGHVLEWIAGIEAMISNPLGLGMGSSGKVSGSLGLNIGGENQFIIIGVQAGIIALLFYLLIHLILISKSKKWISFLEGKERKVAIALFLFKIGSIISLLTTNLESYIYISYMSWFLSGLFVNVISKKASN